MAANRSTSVWPHKAKLTPGIALWCSEINQRKVRSFNSGRILAIDSCLDRVEETELTH